MKLYTYYDKDDHPIAEADSIRKLANKIGVTFQTVSHGLHRGSVRYSVEEIGKEDWDGRGTV